MTTTARRVLALGLAATLGAAAPPDAARRAATAARVTITRDDWGIAHVHGRSDADAVFGAIYAQAEDDFPRVEANLLTALGRSAEADGETAIWADLRQRLFVDPEALKADYARSPPWLRALMTAWADGLNAYLAANPGKAKVLTRFEPWMALSFTEGSIGGDIERADLTALAAFYGDTAPKIAADRDALRQAEPRGSNGIAIGPSLAANGRAMLLINPHTSFFFRSELGMSSDAGLHAYGASTWGQFFLYQGFNRHVGWMHTTSGADSVDEFAETVERQRGTLGYRYGKAFRPLRTATVTIRYRTADGGMTSRDFTTYASEHGPIVRAGNGKWIAMALLNAPIAALEQSWLRTRARSFAEYEQVADRKANSSNNTIFASSAGTIAYLHPQFVPRRAAKVDYRGVVDGSDPATAWTGLHAAAELPRVVDPKGGWLYNSNDAPWRAAGADSPKAADFPAYADTFGANPRGDHATALLGAARKLTPEGLMAIAYDAALPAFDTLLPPLFAAFDALPAADPQRALLAEPVAMLRAWDRRAGAASEATTLAVFFGEAMWSVRDADDDGVRNNAWEAMAAAIPAQRLAALAAGVNRLRTDWGSVNVPWGEVNRCQRTTADIVQPFSDAKPSTPVPFASARWGSLASFGARPYPGTRRWYGTSGNSFVAVVEFGPRVRAWAVTAGGESGDPSSPHFADEVDRYASGKLRPVYFYPADLKGHIERTYHPGG